MRLQERLKRVLSKTEELRSRTQEKRDQQHTVYFWDRFEQVPPGQNSEVLLKYLTLWLEGDNDTILAAYPMEEWPNLYLWLTAVYQDRPDLAPALPVTAPLPSEEMDRRLSLFEGRSPLLPTLTASGKKIKKPETVIVKTISGVSMADL